MELKQQNYETVFLQYSLLIVPYGIETSLPKIRNYHPIHD